MYPLDSSDLSSGVPLLAQEDALGPAVNKSDPETSPTGILEADTPLPGRDAFRAETQLPSTPVPAPEPSSILLLGSGLLMLGFFGRRRKRKRHNAVNRTTAACSQHRDMAS